MRTSIILLLLIFFALSPAFAWQGKVVKVTAGDIIVVNHDGKEEMISLYGIDAPEAEQSFGSCATQFTGALVFDKTVEIETIDDDSYGRTVGLVHYDDNEKCLNEELIRSGFAWVQEDTCEKPECKAWLQLENVARSLKIGLWVNANPIPPWDYRNGVKENGSAAGLLFGLLPMTARPKKRTASVYITKSGSTYHRGNCTSLKKSKIRISLDDALSNGYRPCYSCRFAHGKRSSWHCTQLWGAVIIICLSGYPANQTRYIMMYVTVCIDVNSPLCVSPGVEKAVLHSLL